MMSMANEEIDIFSAADMGVKGYFSKNIRPASLVTALQAVHNGEHRQLSSEGIYWFPQAGITNENPGEITLNW